MKYFTKKEVEEFKKSSLQYPFIEIWNHQHEVVRVSEIVSIAGMADNNGIPNEINIQVHVKGKPTKHLKYKLEAE